MINWGNTMTEAIAEPGGICLSGKVYDEIQGRIDLTYEDLGAQQLKNIDRLVSVYRALVRAGPEASPSPKKASLALPDRPSIAVLPFKHFFDGLRKAGLPAKCPATWMLFFGTP